jgi:Zn-dependent protease
LALVESEVASNLASVTPKPSSSIRLFQLVGIQVFLHWSWFIVAFYEISTRRSLYSVVGWNVAEYLALFVIVLTHEFGHALACRQVGGTADTIVLWPFGGVAYISAPPRPGAQLWSIAAGPLVNVVFAIVFFGIGQIDAFRQQLALFPDFGRFFMALQTINLGLLIFNLLPIFPLDGGQILRSLLWFVIGRARSLFTAAVIGAIGIVLLLGYAAWAQSLWVALISLFLLQLCWQGIRQAKALRQIERLPKHAEFSCPTCQGHPPSGPIYTCNACGKPFDPFVSAAVCPNCGNNIPQIPCVHCGTIHTPTEWGLRA